jgi:hypothetical protein
MPVILATQEAEIRKIVVGRQPGQIVHERPYLKKPFTKIGLVEWLKVKAPSSSPSTAKKTKTKTNKQKNPELSYDPAIPFLGIYPKECKSA